MVKRGPDKTVSDERILIEMLVAEGPAVFTSEIENEVSITRQRLNDRLSELEESGYVTSKHASGRRLWWLTSEGVELAKEYARADMG